VFGNFHAIGQYTTAPINRIEENVFGFYVSVLLTAASSLLFSEIHSLQTDIYGRMERWLGSLPAIHKTRIQQHFGEIPALDSNPSGPNGPAWAWWCMAVLPIEPRIQLALLAMASYADRLKAINKVDRLIVCMVTVLCNHILLSLYLFFFFSTEPSLSPVLLLVLISKQLLTTCSDKDLFLLDCHV
jgi:hypothetical protein